MKGAWRMKRFLMLACVCFFCMECAAAEPWSEPLRGMYFKDQGAVSTTYRLLYAREPTDQDITRTTELAEAFLAAENKKVKIVVGPAPGKEPYIREMVVFTGFAEFQKLEFTSVSDIEKTCMVDTKGWKPAMAPKYGILLSDYLWKHDPKAKKSKTFVTVTVQDAHLDVDLKFAVLWSVVP